MPRLTSPSRRAANLLLESASTAAGMSLDIGIHNADLQKQLVKFARTDLRIALKRGSVMLANARTGRVQLELQDDGTIRVIGMRGITAFEIARGTVAQLAPVVAGLFDVSDDA
jgi:hypothetical protein